MQPFKLFYFTCSILFQDLLHTIDFQFNRYLYLFFDLEPNSFRAEISAGGKAFLEDGARAARRLSAAKAVLEQCREQRDVKPVSS